MKGIGLWKTLFTASVCLLCDPPTPVDNTGGTICLLCPIMDHGVVEPTLKQRTITYIKDNAVWPVLEREIPISLYDVLGIESEGIPILLQVGWMSASALVMLCSSFYENIIMIMLNLLRLPSINLAILWYEVGYVMSILDELLSAYQLGLGYTSWFGYGFEQAMDQV